MTVSRRELLKTALGGMAAAVVGVPVAAEPNSAMAIIGLPGLGPGDAISVEGIEHVFVVSGFVQDVTDKSLRIIELELKDNLPAADQPPEWTYS